MSEESPELDKDIQKIENHTGILVNIINSVKDMYVVESRGKDLELSKTSLLQSVDYAQKYLEEKLSNKRIKLEYESENLTPYYILAEKNIFKHQVLVNILNNCINFSYENSGIEIWAELNPLNSNKVDLHIKDHGIGMSQKILENLFNPKVMTTRSGTRNELGTGLGMLIVKTMLNSMNGKILVKSSEVSPSGTEFILTLPKSKK